MCSCQRVYEYVCVRVFLFLFRFDCCYYCNFILNILFSLLSFVRSSFPFLLSSCCSFVCIFVTLNAAFLILRRWIKMYTPHLSSTFAFTYVYCYAMLCSVHYSLSVCFDVSLASYYVQCECTARLVEHIRDSAFPFSPSLSLTEALAVRASMCKCMSLLQLSEHSTCVCKFENAWCISSS